MARTPPVSPDGGDDDQDAVLTRYGDVVCALVAVLGPDITVAIPANASAQTRLVLAQLEADGLMKGGRTPRSGTRPFRFLRPDLCRARGLYLLE